MCTSFRTAQENLGAAELADCFSTPTTCTTVGAKLEAAVVSRCFVHPDAVAVIDQRIGSKPPSFSTVR